MIVIRTVKMYSNAQQTDVEVALSYSPCIVPLKPVSRISNLITKALLPSDQN